MQEPLAFLLQTVWVFIVFHIVTNICVHEATIFIFFHRNVSPLFICGCFSLQIPCQTYARHSWLQLACSCIEFELNLSYLACFAKCFFRTVEESSRLRISARLPM